MYILQYWFVGSSLYLQVYKYTHFIHFVHNAKYSNDRVRLPYSWRVKRFRINGSDHSVRVLIVICIRSYRQIQISQIFRVHSVLIESTFSTVWPFSFIDLLFHVDSSKTKKKRKTVPFRKFSYLLLSNYLAWKNVSRFEIMWHSIVSFVFLSRSKNFIFLSVISK